MGLCFISRALIGLQKLWHVQKKKIFADPRGFCFSVATWPAGSHVVALLILAPNSVKNAVVYSFRVLMPSLIKRVIDEKEKKKKIYNYEFPIKKKLNLNFKIEVVYFCVRLLWPTGLIGLPPSFILLRFFLLWGSTLCLLLLWWKLKKTCLLYFFSPSFHTLFIIITIIIIMKTLKKHVECMKIEIKI